MRLGLCGALVGACLSCCAWVAAFGQALPWPGPGGVVVQPATVALSDHIVNNSPGACPVTIAANIGTAGSSSYVGVAIQAFQNAPTAMTIDGVSATSLVNQANGTANVAVYLAPVSTSGTKNIVVSCAGTPQSIYIGVWRINNLLSATPTDTKVTTTNGGTMTLSSVLAGGILLAAGTTNQSGAVSTWNVAGSNVTADWDDHPAAQYVLSGYSFAYSTLQTSLAVKDTLSPAGSPAFVSVSLR